MSLSLFPLTLVLGGQRSGKSAYGESLFGEGGYYVATGAKLDDEMAARIEIHQDRRGSNWETIEEPHDLVRVLAGLDERPVLIDSIGMWVSNMLHAGRDLDGDGLAEALSRHPAPVVVVSEQVGLGVVPMNKVARNFVDALGHVNQSLAAQADRVVLVTVGLPLILKEQNTR